MGKKDFKKSKRKRQEKEEEEDLSKHKNGVVQQKKKKEKKKDSTASFKSVDSLKGLTQKEGTDRTMYIDSVSSSSSSCCGKIRDELGLKVAYFTKPVKDEHHHQQQKEQDGEQEEHTDTSQYVPMPFSKSCLDRNDSTTPTSSSSRPLPLVLQLASQTLYNIQKKQHNKKTQQPQQPTIRPTPIQLQSWSILNNNKSSNTSNSNSTNSQENIKMIAIAPTGSGKTLAYTIPIATHCIELLLQQQYQQHIPKRYVHGLILVPTRELAIQVSKVVKQVAKRANKILVSMQSTSTTTSSSSQLSQGKIVSVAIFGGVNKQEQIDALLVGTEQETVEGTRTTCTSSTTALIVAATPGRLGDLLGLTPQQEEEQPHVGGGGVNGQDENTRTSTGRLTSRTTTTTTTCDTGNANDSVDKGKDKHITGTISNEVEQIRTLFRLNLKACIIDEADRMASQADMRQQLDPILQDLLVENTPMDDGGSRMMCLYSATLPQRVQPKFDEWLGFPRYVITVDMLSVGSSAASTSDPHQMKAKSALTSALTSTREEEACPDEGNSIKKHGEELEITSEIDQSQKKRSNGFDLSTIPPHVRQTLHVCSNHKKPKKLVHTMKKIRSEEGKDMQGKDMHRRRKGLTIIFFGRIKTLQYISAMFRKEGIPCVELHGQMNQQRRESQLNLFRCGKIPTLLATDVAARGLHVNNVESIVNYDFPGSLEQVRLPFKRGYEYFLP